MMENSCVSCRRSKVTSHCEICQGSLCKSCVQFLEEGTFSFLKEIPKDLSHSRYCSACFQEKIEPALESYQETMEKAKGVYIFFITQKKPIPLIGKSKESMKVENCVDRDETILRLAFRAAEQGYNAVIQTEVIAKKVRNEGYQKSSWQGVGIPAQVDAEKMERWSE